MLISDAYRQLNAELHASKSYGATGAHYADVVRRYSETLAISNAD